MKLLLQLLKAEHLNFISQMLEKSLSDGCLLRKMSDSTALRTKPRGINMRHQIDPFLLFCSIQCFQSYLCWFPPLCSVFLLPAEPSPTEGNKQLKQNI